MRTLTVLLLCAASLFAQFTPPPSGGGSVTTGCGLKGTTTISATGPCWAVGGGTAQAQTATFSPAVVLADGLEICWKPTAANTAAGTTFAPNGLTAHTIVKAGGALVANDIITTAQACAVYNTTGTKWELQNPQTVAVTSAVGGTGAVQIANGTAFNGDNTRFSYNSAGQLGHFETFPNAVPQYNSSDYSVWSGLNCTAVSGACNLGANFKGGEMDGTGGLFGFSGMSTAWDWYSTGHIHSYRGLNGTVTLDAGTSDIMVGAGGSAQIEDPTNTVSDRLVAVEGWLGVYDGVVANAYTFNARAPSTGGAVTGINAAWRNQNFAGLFGIGKDFAWYSEGGTNHLETGAADAVGMEIESHAGQTADLFRTLASDGTTVQPFFIGASGVEASRTQTVASLPACVATTGTPWRASVSDATAPALGSAVTGGGAVFANVHCSLTSGTYLVDGL